MTDLNAEDLKIQVKKYLSDYSREWRKKNPDKVKRINMRYWLKKANEEAEKNSK